MDSPGVDGEEARAKAAREKLDGQPLTLSKSYINNFDGDYQYVDLANDKPHWKSESGMHLYWGPRQMWLLRSRFTPDNPTASAFCDEEDLFMGDNDFQWSTTTSWVPSVLRVDPGPPEEELAPNSLRFAQCLVSKFDGVYELTGQANGRPHWSCDDGTAGGLHLYWGPQGLWLLRSVFDPASKSCSAYCSCSDTPAGSNLWHWMRGGDWHPQELAIDVGPDGDGDAAYVAVDTQARAALPDGWTEDQDEKGETYFVNGHTGATQWEKPTLPADREEEASDSDDEELADDGDSVDGQDDEVADDGDEEVADDGEDEGWELPEGWEAGTSTTTGETYYINTLNDERTWDRPTQTAAEVVAAAAESGLPAGWKCKVSGSTGETYYFNTETGETQWDRPMTKESDPLGEIFEHADMGKKGFLDKEDVNALIRAMGYEVREEYVDGVLQLYGEDSDQGRAGIHFGPNFKLLWEHLGGKPDGSMSTIGGADGDGPGDIDGEKLEKRELPPGWETAVSNETGEVYYVNQRTGESQFTFPEEELDEAGDLPAGWEQIVSRTTGVVTYLNTLSGEQVDARPTEPAVGEDGAVADDGPSGDAPPVVGAPAIDGDLAAPDVGGMTLPPRDLPQGWETARSKNTGKVYYINKWTRESQYEFPAMAALPAGWTAALSTTTGEQYYVNSVSGETQFEFPDAPAEGMDTGAEQSSGGAKRTVSKDRPLPPGWDTATSRSTNQKFYVNVVTGESQTDFPSAPALPDGWDMATSQNTGRVYYLNSKTGAISYELPSMPARAREDELAEVRHTALPAFAPKTKFSRDCAVLSVQIEIQEHAAAIRIQAAYRGSRERRMIEEELEEQLQGDELFEHKQKQKQKKRCDACPARAFLTVPHQTWAVGRAAFLASTEGVPPPMLSGERKKPDMPPPRVAGSRGGGASPATPSRRPPSKPGRSPPGRPAPTPGGSGRRPKRAPPKRPPPRAAPKRAPPRRPPPASPGGSGRAAPSRPAPSPGAPKRAPPSPASSGAPQRAPPSTPNRASSGGSVPPVRAPPTRPSPKPPG